MTSRPTNWVNCRSRCRVEFSWVELCRYKRALRYGIVGKLLAQDRYMWLKRYTHWLCMDFLATRITSSYCATVNLGFYGGPSYKERSGSVTVPGWTMLWWTGWPVVSHWHWHVPRGRRTCSVSAGQWRRHNGLDKSPHKRTVGPRPIKATATATTIPENKDRVTALRWQ